MLAVFFCAASAKAVFTVIYLQQKGLSNSTIGLIFSINAFIVILSQPFWGIVSDWGKSKKNVLLLCFGMGTIIYSLLLLTNSALLIGLILAVASFFECAMASILDIWILSSIGISYGAIRLWGSIGFSMIVLIYGQVIGNGSVSVFFPIYFIISAITVLILCLFDINDNSESVPSLKQKRFLPKKLTKNFNYIVFLVFIFLLYLPNSPVGTFLPNLFQMTGGTVEQFGMMNSIKAFAEIPAFLCGAYLLKKFGHIKLIFFSASLYLMAQLLFAIAVSPLQVAFGHIMQGPAYSLFLLGTLTYVFKLAPDDMKSTAQTLVNALGMGLSAVIGNYGGGLLIDKFGLKPLYWTGTIMVLIAISLFAFSFILGKLIVNKRLKTKISA